MALSCPLPLSPSGGSGGGVQRGGVISATMKDSDLRRHSTHSINEGEGLVLRSSVAWRL